MDNNSIGVLTTLGIDLLGAVIFGLVWLLIRWCRGDKKKGADIADGGGGLRNNDLNQSNLKFKDTIANDTDGNTNVGSLKNRHHAD